MLVKVKCRFIFKKNSDALTERHTDANELENRQVMYSDDVDGCPKSSQIITLNVTDKLSCMVNCFLSTLQELKAGDIHARLVVII